MSQQVEVSTNRSSSNGTTRPRYTKYVRKGHEYARTYVGGQYRHLGKFDSKGSWDKFNAILEAWKEGAFDPSGNTTLLLENPSDRRIDSRGDNVTSRPDIHAAHVSVAPDKSEASEDPQFRQRNWDDGCPGNCPACPPKANGNSWAFSPEDERPETGTSRSPERHSEHVPDVSASGRDSLSDNELNLPGAGNILVCELVAQYVDYALEYYGDHGKRRSTVNNLKPTLRSLLENYGETFAEDFGPRSLKALRETWIERGHSRSYCNDQSGVIKRVFQFGVEEELVSGECYQALRAVRNLKRGRTRAHETPPVLPIDDSVVDCTIEAAHAILAAMIRLQRLTGMRPSEVCQIRPCDIDRGVFPPAGKPVVWWFTPQSHKTEHHGKQRIIAIGPRGQDVIMPYLLRGPADYCFRPCDISKQGKLQYTTDGYRQAIWRACDRAGVDRWSPNRLRHTAATEVRKQHGLEATQVVLGHSKADVTQVYAERDMKLAERVARETG